MGDVLHKTRDPVDYRTSVNTPEYDPADWFHSPDTSAVVGVPRKYWQRPLADPVLEMTQAEKDAVDAAAAAAAATAAKTGAKTRHDAEDGEGRALRALVKLMVAELNILRAEHGLADRTYAQARTAIDAEIDGE